MSEEGTEGTSTRVLDQPDAGRPPEVATGSTEQTAPLPGRRTARKQKLRFVCDLGEGVSISTDELNLILRVDGQNSFYSSLGGLLLDLEHVARRKHWQKEQRADLRALSNAERDIKDMLNQWLHILVGHVREVVGLVAEANPEHQSRKRQEARRSK